MEYQLLEVENGKPIKMWTHGVPVEDEAQQQLVNIANLPFIHKWIAAMPDVHLGMGATVGSVIPTLGAIIPAAVGVDIGCGMMAVRTTLTAADLPDNLQALRSAIERAVPHGRIANGGKRDKGAWETPPESVDAMWAALQPGFERIADKHPRMNATPTTASTWARSAPATTSSRSASTRPTTCGSCCTAASRGVGNRSARTSSSWRRPTCASTSPTCPTRTSRISRKAAEHFDDYVEAVGWAQDFARRNREVMMQNVIAAARGVIGKPFETHVEAVNCHHNYVQKETHFGTEVLVTRKGAVRRRRASSASSRAAWARSSYIVRGLGNAEAF